MIMDESDAWSGMGGVDGALGDWEHIFLFILIDGAFVHGLR